MWTLILIGGRAWLELRRKLELILDESPQQPRGRAGFILSMDFVSALLVPSPADTANIGCTDKAGALAKEVFCMFGKKYLAKYCFKRES